MRRIAGICGDGSYEKSEAGDNAFCAHTYFMKNQACRVKGRWPIIKKISPMNNQDTAQHVMSAIRDERLAIIDIGSNSIRMVIYHNAGIYPFPVFNERVTCRLGAALDKTGEMAQENMEAAFVALRRFAVILQSLQPDSVRVVATAAARRAQNASVFLDTATKILGQEIEVLPAEEEARLIAQPDSQYACSFWCSG